MNVLRRFRGWERQDGRCSCRRLRVRQFRCSPFARFRTGVSRSIAQKCILRGKFPIFQSHRSKSFATCEVSRTPDVGRDRGGHSRLQIAQATLPWDATFRLSPVFRFRCAGTDAERPFSSSKRREAHRFDNGPGGIMGQEDCQAELYEPLDIAARAGHMLVERKCAGNTAYAFWL